MYAIIKSLVCFDVLYVVALEVPEDSAAAYRTVHGYMLTFCLTSDPSSLSQAREVQPQDKTHIRPILVAVGLLLAPDGFQMVLDADNTSKSTDFSSSLSVFTKTQ